MALNVDGFEQRRSRVPGIFHAHRCGLFLRRAFQTARESVRFSLFCVPRSIRTTMFGTAVTGRSGNLVHFFPFFFFDNLAASAFFSASSFSCKSRAASASCATCFSNLHSNENARAKFLCYWCLARTIHFVELMLGAAKILFQCFVFGTTTL